MIPMRDGIRLHAVVFTPKGQTESLPFLLTRTPYGAVKYPSPDKFKYIEDMAKEGYIFVMQDIRGRYGSEGTYVMQRFPRDKNDPKAIDESTDTYDTFDWLLKNIPDNNGKAGIYGISYDGWTTIMGAIDPHPAVKAVSDQGTPADMFLGDDFHHNGAFRLSYAFEYAFMEEISKTDSLFPFPDRDTYGWYLNLGSLSNVNNKYFLNRLPSWNNFVLHPNYDEYWKKQTMTAILDSPRVPTLTVGGFWDQEDMYGPQKEFELWDRQDPHRYNHLVLGPWNHGGWGFLKGDYLGRISFDSATGDHFRKNIQARWFAWYLKGKGDSNFAKVITFQTGSNRWKTYDSWPPPEAKTKSLYLNEGGRLSFTPPGGAPATGAMAAARTSGSPGFDSYRSDPANPVPYRTQPIEETYGRGSRWYTWLTEDQRFLKDRPDVLSWSTDVLNEDLTVTGKLVADIYAATTGTDADWVVKLIDVYPDRYPKESALAGYQLMIAGDVFRARFRKSFEHPEPVIPDKVEEYSIDLHTQDHVFKKGHRIMVQVQSTWFPIIDRNPQTYVPNIFEAKEKDYQPATQKIYRSGQWASRILLPVVE